MKQSALLSTIVALFELFFIQKALNMDFFDDIMNIFTRNQMFFHVLVGGGARAHFSLFLKNTRNENSNEAILVIRSRTQS